MMSLLDQWRPKSFLKNHDRGSYKLVIYKKFIMWQTSLMSVLVALVVHDSTTVSFTYLYITHICYIRWGIDIIISLHRGHYIILILVYSLCMIYPSTWNSLCICCWIYRVFSLYTVIHCGHSYSLPYVNSHHNILHSTKKPVTTMLTYPWKCSFTL